MAADELRLGIEEICRSLLQEKNEKPSIDQEEDVRLLSEVLNELDWLPSKEDESSRPNSSRKLSGAAETSFSSGVPPSLASNRSGGKTFLARTRASVTPPSSSCPSSVTTEPCVDKEQPHLNGPRSFLVQTMNNKKRPIEEVSPSEAYAKEQIEKWAKGEPSKVKEENEHRYIIQSNTNELRPLYHCKICNKTLSSCHLRGHSTSASASTTSTVSTTPIVSTPSPTSASAATSATSATTTTDDQYAPFCSLGNISSEWQEVFDTMSYLIPSYVRQFSKQSVIILLDTDFSSDSHGGRLSQLGSALIEHLNISLNVLKVTIDSKEKQLNISHLDRILQQIVQLARQYNQLKFLVVIPFYWQGTVGNIESSINSTLSNLVFLIASKSNLQPEPEDKNIKCWPSQLTRGDSNAMVVGSISLDADKKKWTKSTPVEQSPNVLFSIGENNLTSPASVTAAIAIASYWEFTKDLNTIKDILFRYYNSSSSVCNLYHAFVESLEENEHIISRYRNKNVEAPTNRKERAATLRKKAFTKLDISQICPYVQGPLRSDFKLIVDVHNQIGDIYINMSDSLNEYPPISTNVATLFSRINTNLNVLKDLSYRIAVFGTQKSGKSTTLCAIVGKNVLPVRDTGMTILPTEIHDSPSQQTPSLEIPKHELFSSALMQVSQRHESKPFDFAKSGVGRSFIELISKPTSFPSRVQGEAEVCETLVLLNDLCRLCIIEDLEFNPLKDLGEWPRIFIEFRTIEGMTRGTGGKIVLVDMPGSDEAYMLKTVQQLMATEVQRSAALLLLVNYTIPDNSAQNLLRQNLAIFSNTQVKQDVYVVINKIDEASPKKRDVLLKDLSEKIIKALPANFAAMRPSIHYISAKYATVSITMNAMLDTMSLEDIVSSEEFEEFAHVAWPMEELEDVKDKTKKALRTTCSNMMKKSCIDGFLKDVILVAMVETATRAINKVVCDLDAFLFSFQNWLELERAVSSDSIDKNTIVRFEQRLGELSETVRTELAALNEFLTNEFSVVQQYQVPPIDKQHLKAEFRKTYPKIKNLKERPFSEGDLSNAAEEFLGSYYNTLIATVAKDLDQLFFNARKKVNEFSQKKLFPALKQLIDEAASELNVKLNIPTFNFIAPPPMSMKPFVGQEKSKLQYETKWIFSIVPIPTWHTIHVRTVTEDYVVNQIYDQLVESVNNTKQNYWTYLNDTVRVPCAELSGRMNEVLSAFHQIRSRLKEKNEGLQESKLAELKTAEKVCDNFRQQIHRLRVEFQLSPADQHQINFIDLNIECAISNSAFSVYRGTWRPAGSAAVAMKKVPMFPELEKRWKDASWIQGIRHPNLTTLYGVCTDAPPENGINYCYIVSSLAEIEFGGKLRTCSLQQLIHEVKYSFNMPTFLKIAIGVASGMEYLHSAKSVYVHRDLKSSNIMMTYGFTPKICDFVKSSICSAAQLNMEDVGSKLWMAPEVKSGTYNSSADVYSFGWILWELATGKYPWNGLEPNYTRDLSQLEIEFIPTLQGFIDNHKATLADLIRSCLNSDTTLRPSFASILQSLADIKAHFVFNRKQPIGITTVKQTQSPTKMLEVLDAQLDGEDTRLVTSSFNINRVDLDTKIQKSIRECLLKTDSSLTTRQNIQVWRNLLTNPREQWNSIINRWYQTDSRIADERSFRIVFVISSNTETVTKIVDKCLQGASYNALSVSLRVYDTHIDWRNNSLAYLREGKLEDPLLLLSLGEISIKRIGPEKYECPVIDKLCEAMREWNLTREYNVYSSNSAHFVHEMMARIQEVDPNLKLVESKPHDKAMEVFLKRVGRGILEKTITQEMFDFKLKDIREKEVSSVTFYTHTGLDLWANKLFKVHGREKIMQSYPHLYTLLKAFDRSFGRDFSLFSAAKTMVSKEIDDLQAAPNSNLEELGKRKAELKIINEIASKAAKGISACAFDT